MQRTLDENNLLPRFVLGLCRMLTKDLADEQLADQPAPGVNHPAWILGHLALSSDYGLRLLGAPMRCPREWHKLFGMGTKPVADRALYPPKAELWAAAEAGYAALGEALRQAPAERLQAKHTLEFIAAALPTVGDLLAHLLTTHVSFHAGQLAMWRRLKGLPPLV